MYLLLQRREEKEKGRETSVCDRDCTSRTPPTRNLAHNPAVCPEWESNQRRFGSWAGAQSTEPIKAYFLKGQVKLDRKTHGDNHLTFYTQTLTGSF